MARAMDVRWSNPDRCWVSDCGEPTVDRSGRRQRKRVCFREDDEGAIPYGTKPRSEGFSGRKGTPPADARLAPERVGSVPEHIAEGRGVRQAGRLCGVHRDTLGRDRLRAGEHAHRLQDESVALCPRACEAQFGETWALVAKQQAHCDPLDLADDRTGDAWDHVATEAVGGSGVRRWRRGWPDHVGPMGEWSSRPAVRRC